MTTVRNSTSEFEFDVALSFAGEDREYAERIAGLLEGNGVTVFYDKYERADLWGKNLYDHLADIYTNKAQYCIMIISEAYASKAWTNHERQSAQARAFKENKEYILPVRLDDTAIPGIPETVFYLDLREMSVEEVVHATLDKLGGVRHEMEPAVEPSPGIPMPRARRVVTQRDKDHFLQESYDAIVEYFKTGLSIMGKQEGYDGDLKPIHATKFIARAYVHGERKSHCKIWIGGGFGGNTIAYSHNDMDIDNDGTLNDWLSVEEDEGGLLLKPSGMSFHMGTGDRSLLSKQEAAEYFWKLFIERLEY